MGFLSAMFSETAARRRRLRAQFGDFGQALGEFALMSGLVVGSLGLWLAPWMAAAAPWGFAMPAVFAAGIVLIELRRQRAKAPDAATFDWAVLLWSMACALAGAAAFVIAWSARPAPPPPDPGWQPPESAIPVEISP